MNINQSFYNTMPLIHLQQIKRYLKIFDLRSVKVSKALISIRK